MPVARPIFKAYCVEEVAGRKKMEGRGVMADSGRYCASCVVSVVAATGPGTVHSARADRGQNGRFLEKRGLGGGGRGWGGGYRRKRRLFV